MSQFGRNIECVNEKNILRQLKMTSASLPDAASHCGPISSRIVTDRHRDKGHADVAELYRSEQLIREWQFNLLP